MQGWWRWAPLPNYIGGCSCTKACLTFGLARGNSCLLDRTPPVWTPRPGAMTRSLGMWAPRSDPTGATQPHPGIFPYSSYLLSLFPPQGLCPCHPVYQTHPPPSILSADSISSWTQLKGPLLERPSLPIAQSGLPPILSLTQLFPFDMICTCFMYCFCRVMLLILSPDQKLLEEQGVCYCLEPSTMPGPSQAHRE